MAAIVYLQEFNGEAPGVATAKNGEAIQFKSEDDPTVEAPEAVTAGLTKPNAGVFRSFEKYLQVYLESLGGSTNIGNLEVFISGSSPDDGTAIFAKVAAEYDDPLVGGYLAGGAMEGPKTDLFTYTSEAPLVLGVGPFDTELEAAGNFAILQMEIYPSAAIGSTSNFSLVLRYDETT